MTEFPGKNWSLASLSRLMHQIDSTGSADRKSGSGRPRTACVDMNVEVVEEMVMSQENAPGSHRTHLFIASSTVI